jgi:hypothetical protein
MWRKGLMGGFKYKRVQVIGDEKFSDEPDKNIYSHICEAGEYGLQGAGEGAASIAPPKSDMDGKQVSYNSNFEVF